MVYAGACDDIDPFPDPRCVSVYGVVDPMDLTRGRWFSFPSVYRHHVLHAFGIVSVSTAYVSMDLDGSRWISSPFGVFSCVPMRSSAFPYVSMDYTLGTSWAAQLSSSDDSPIVIFLLLLFQTEKLCTLELLGSEHKQLSAKFRFSCPSVKF